MESKQQKRKFITVPLTEEEHKKIKTKAEKEHRSVSAYMRLKSLGL